MEIPADFEGSPAVGLVMLVIAAGLLAWVVSGVPQAFGARRREWLAHRRRLSPLPVANVGGQLFVDADHPLAQEAVRRLGKCRSQEFHAAWAELDAYWEGTVQPELVWFEEAPIEMGGPMGEC